MAASSAYSNSDSGKRGERSGSGDSSGFGERSEAGGSGERSDSGDSSGVGERSEWHRYWEFYDDCLACLPLRELGMGFVSSTRACGDMRLDPSAQRNPSAERNGADRGDVSARGEAGARLRTGFAARFAPGRPLLYARQVHGDRVALLSDEREGVYDGREEVYDGFDGFFVPFPLDPAVGVFSADCLALCLFDSKRRDFALVHSGWRGSRAGITAKALGIFAERGARAPDMHLAFAPSIQACCYQVGMEFTEYFPKGSLREREGRLYLDNQGSVIASCLEFGVLPQHIYPSPHCTACDAGRFFSHRRDGQDAGRMFTIAYRLP